METAEMLARKIWITRKARIRASERLARRDEYSKLMLAYYSFASLAFSVIELKLRRLPTNFPLYDVLLGILLFGAAIYVNTLNFASRSDALKQCYLSLDQLYVELCKAPDGSQLIESISQRYNEILQGSENHSEYDYISVMVDNSPAELSRRQRRAYTFYRALMRLLVVFATAFPVVLGVWVLK